MSSSKNQRDVENRLKEALQADRARIQVGRISRFGLLEMSRQRLRLSLGESAQEICPRCEGRGTVRNIQSHGLSIIRLIEEEALKEKTAEIQVQLPPEMATFMMNERRDYIKGIEKRHHVSVIVVANPYLQTPQYSITRVKEDNVSRSKKPSYTLIQQPEVDIVGTGQVALHDEPVVKPFTDQHLPKPAQLGFIKKIWSNLFGNMNEASFNTQDQKVQGGQSPQTHPREQNRERRGPGSQNRRRRPSGNQQQRPSHHTASGNINPNQQRKKPNPNPQHQQGQGYRPKKKEPVVTKDQGEK